MVWLNFKRPLEDELQIENQARLIRHCDDPKEMKVLAEQLFRSWAQQCDVTAQLVRQIAELEVRLGDVDPESAYVKWAKSLTATGAAEHIQSA